MTDKLCGDALQSWHDRLGAMIDQVGHPDYSLREMVDGMRQIRDEMIVLRAAPPTTKPSGEAVVRKYTLEEVAVNYVAADKPVFEAWLDREIRASTPPTTKEPK